MGTPLTAMLATMRSSVDALLTDSVTNRRTNAVLPCLIIADNEKRGFRLPGVPASYSLLRRWEISVPLGSDIQIGDVLHHATKGDFACVMVADSATSTYDVRILTYAVQLGTAVVCSTKRQPSALALNATAAYATYLSTLNVRPLGNSAILFQPISSSDAQDAFGVAVQQPLACYADWPAGNADIAPVLPNDLLVTPSSGSFVVQGVQSFPNWFIAITVEAAIS